MSSAKKLVIIGAGPGGYTAAFIAADAGIPVSLIDERPVLGGICLNEGCIPVKTLINATHSIAVAKEAAAYGVDFPPPAVDLQKLRSWKDQVTGKLTSGLGILCKQRKIEFIQGKASFLDENTVSVVKLDGSESKLSFTDSIIACGSSPIRLPDITLSDRIIDSTAALNLTDVPESLLIIGGGYIGVELGSVFANLGAKVSIVEMLPQLLGETDSDLVNALQRRLQKLFHSIMTSSRVTGLHEKGSKVEAEILDGKNTKNTYTYDKVLIAIGRRPDASSLKLQNTNITTDAKGFIEVNGQRQTKVPNIFAIGDITGQPMLAHKAVHEAHVAVNNIIGKESKYCPQCIPAVVFTDPEIAYCGLTEKQAKTQGMNVKITKFPWAASGRAMTLNRTEGFTKLLTEPETNKLLGGAIVGPHAGEMISEIALAVETGMEASALQHVHPHPTLSETIMEAADLIYGECAHIYRPK